MTRMMIAVWYHCARPQNCRSEGATFMKLLRLAPENTKFPFMRFRRMSYPFSAVLSMHRGRPASCQGHEFRHRLRRRHGDRTARQIRRGRSRPALRAMAEGLGLGRHRGAGDRRASDGRCLRSRLQPGGDVGAGRRRSSKRARRRRRTITISAASRSSARASRANWCSPACSASCCRSCAVLTYLWFRFEWQFAIGAIIAHHARSAADRRLLLVHAARVQHRHRSPRS